MDFNEETEPDYLVKIVIIGDSGVGKSNIMGRFTNDQFFADSKTTIGVAFATKSIFINPSNEADKSKAQKSVKLQVWDTAGQERYRALSSAYYRGAMGALVVYDITNKASFESISKWLDEIDQYCSQETVVILVGNKLDLVDSRVISVEEGRSIAERENMYFIETSAKDATNIEKAFSHVSKEIIQSSSTSTNELKPKKTYLENGVTLQTIEEDQSIETKSSVQKGCNFC